MKESKHHSRRQKLWMGLAVVLAVLVGITESFRRHQQFHASIRTVHRVSSIVASIEYLNYVQATFFKDQLKRPVACMLCMYDDFDPNLPTMRHSYYYDRLCGGILNVEGVPFRRSTPAALFVNGPYGATVRIDLNQSEADDLFGRTKTNQLQVFWKDFVEPRIYNARGETQSGFREGTWAFDLPTGERYLEGNFSKGKRDGTWTVYYPNGKTQTRKQFLGGQAEGEWEYFDQNGQLVGTLEFVRGQLKDRVNERGAGGAGSFASRLVQDKAGLESGITFSPKDGGVFLLLGKPFPRFPWKPTPDSKS